MQRVSFGKLGFDVSRLGFGCMRLPTVKKDDKNVIDTPEAIRMIRAAIDAGVDYVDTAYGYHNGESERLVALALKDGYREKVKLATKLPQWLVKEPADMDRLLNEQLQKLETDHVDFYLVHALNLEAFHKMQGFGYREFLDRAKKDGRITYAGFSFHDGKDAFLEILDDYDWDMAQVQMNYLDDENQATLEGIRYAGKKGVPIVVMEPLRGGALATPPKEVSALINAHTPRRSAVDWAFRWVAGLPEVAVILSGMSNMEQVQENLKIFGSLEEGNLSKEDAAFYAALKTAYLQRTPIGCTHCDYCQPCPQGVVIPDIFAAYNESVMFDQPKSMLWHYANAVDKGVDASKCVACGACESACPQQLPIIEWLKTVHSAYEKAKE